MPTNNTPVRLLIVEDVEDDAARLIQALESGGYSVSARRVETAEALRAALEQQSWDLLTTDHSLPGFSAPAVVAMAQSLCPHLPILIVSNAISSSLAVELMRAGARDYIRKDNLAALPPVVDRELRAAETERERRQMEAALRESEARWQAALEGAGEGVWDWNLQTGEIFFSRQWKALLGYAEDEVIDLARWEALIHPEDHGRVMANDPALHAGQLSSIFGEYRIRCKGGFYKWIMDHGKVISYTPDGKPLRAIGTQTDITDRKRAEAELKRLKEFNEGIIQSMLEGIVVQDAEGRFTFANAAACRILGRTTGQLLGQPSDDVLSPDHLPRVHAARQRRLAGIQDQYEMAVVRPDGQEVPVLVSGTPRFENGQFAGTLNVFTDLTEHTRMTRQLQESEARFRSVVENAPWGMHFFELAADGRLVFTGANPAADAILGLPHASLVGQTLEAAFPQFAASEIPGHYREAADRGRPWHTEQIGYVNGQVASAYAIHAFQTVPRHMVAVFENILERKRAEETIQAQADALHSQNQELRLQNQELNAQGQALHRIEAELRSSEEKYRTLIETTDTGYVIIDTAGKVLDANAEYLRLAGRESLEDIMGRPVTDWTAPHDHERNAREVQGCLEEGFVRNLEIDYVDPEGRLTPVEINATTLSTENGVVIVGLCRDIGERREVEKALRESKESLLQIASSLREAVWLRDTQSLALLYVNPAYETIWGRSCESFYENPASFLEAVHPEDKARVIEAVQAHSQGKFFNEEYRIVRPDGTQRWVWGRTFPVRNASGEVYRITAVAEDITERQQAGQTLRASEQRFRQLVEHAPIAVAITDAEGRIQQVNRQFVETFGYSQAECPDLERWRELAFPDPARRQAMWHDWLARLAQARQTGSDIVSQSAPMVGRDGVRREMEVRYSQVGRQGIYYFVDVTERQQAQDLLEDLNARLEAEIADREAAEAQTRRLNCELERRVAERTSQLESANRELEAFSFSVSHDLRAPLRVINSYANILQQDYLAQLSDEAQRCLLGVTHNTLRMGQLIDDLLAFSRLGRQPLVKRLVEPARLAQEALDDLRAEQAGRCVELHLGRLPECEADPALLKQVFANLLSNAIKYTRRREVAHIEIGARQEAGQTVYYIKDNGAGFDMQDAGKLFGVFQRLHHADEFEGTGIGLANVQRIVHRHGGRVWAEAEVDRGATFYFTLAEA